MLQKTSAQLEHCTVLLLSFTGGAVEPAAAALPAAASQPAALQCHTRSRGHSVLHGQQPPALSAGIHYWDRSASALQQGLGSLSEISVYYNSKQECIAGIKLSYGRKPGAVAAHLMGSERGPGFYEKLLMLGEKEFINRVDIGFNSR